MTSSPKKAGLLSNTRHSFITDGFPEKRTGRRSVVRVFLKSDK
jgi:hypothetical protein